MPYPTTVDTGQVPLWILEDSGVTGGSAGGALGASQQISVLLYEMQGNATAKDMRYRAGVGTGTVQLGIYDVNGNLLGNTATVATTVSASYQIVALAANVPMSPGRYYFAIWQSLNTDTFFRVTGQINALKGQILSGTFAGGLPATITLGNLSNAVAPSLAVGVVGGL